MNYRSDLQMDCRFDDVPGLKNKNTTLFSWDYSIPSAGFHVSGSFPSCILFPALLRSTGSIRFVLVRLISLDRCAYTFDRICWFTMSCGLRKIASMVVVNHILRCEFNSRSNGLSTREFKSAVVLPCFLCCSGRNYYRNIPWCGQSRT